MGRLFDSLTVGENVAFPLRERKDLSEEQIYQIVGWVAGNGWGETHARAAAVGFIDRA